MSFYKDKLNKTRRRPDHFVIHIYHEVVGVTKTSTVGSSEGKKTLSYYSSVYVAEGKLYTLSCRPPGTWYSGVSELGPKTEVVRGRYTGVDHREIRSQRSRHFSLMIR